jgi:flavodoxin
MGKTLVAYFSYSGITKHLAEKIAQMKGADIFEIEAVKQYPSGYSQLLKESANEQKQNTRPKLKDVRVNMEDYDTVILGYPNWYNTCPMAVLTFLEIFDMSGKTIAPFCTHGGSRMGNSERDIQKSCPSGKVLKGYSGGISAIDELEKWVASI